MANILPLEKKIQILQMLCEGSSLRSISRVTGASINTVTRILADTGKKCEYFQYCHLTDLPSKRIEVDEIWSFCYGKDKNLSAEKIGLEGYGDIWTWTAVDPDSKAVVCWVVGTRGLDHARRFMRDLSRRVNRDIQITSDGHSAYLKAIQAAFGNSINYGMLIKNYSREGLNIIKEKVIGNPDESKISTSAVERQNLAMRMGMRRFTRKTNAHSKKLENHKLAMALYFMYHNYVRVNPTIKMTPAMALGLADRKWSWGDVLNIQ